MKNNPVDPYGYFSEDGRSYTATTNDLPKKWYNCHFSDTDHNAYYHITSQAGNGMSFARSAEGDKAMFNTDKNRTDLFARC